MRGAPIPRAPAPGVPVPRAPVPGPGAPGPAGAGEVADVLALRAHGLGGALTGVAALRGLRRAFPGAVLWLAGPREPATWLRRLGVVDEVLPTTGLRPLPWHPTGHVAVDLHDGGPESHAVLAATDPARLVAFAAEGDEGDGDHEGPAWDPDEHEVERWCRLVRPLGGACDAADLRLDVPAARVPATAVLHPGATAGARRWPEARWVEVAAELAERGLEVVVTGSPDEVRLAERIVLRARGSLERLFVRMRVRSEAGRLDLDALARLVAGATVVVSGDTGVAHLATALGTPSVLLFGPRSPAQRGPALDADRHRVLWHGDPAHPGDPDGPTPDPALLRIEVGEVLAALEALTPALAR